MKKSNGAFTEKPKRSHLPGEAGIWVFVLGDMMVFALFFCTFIYYRAQEVDLFRVSQSALNVNFGAINTIILLTSSVFVVHAVSGARRHLFRRAAVLFALAWLCGLAFGVIKVIEYSQKVRIGITPTSNLFFTFYFMLTGIHFVHVLAGLVALGVLCQRARRPRDDIREVALYETGATFWHMVDLLWILLFPLLYLIK
jgi:nitric oxide reductase NorE protein